MRAALESLAYQVYDLVDAMQKDARMPMSLLNVDGGAAANDFLMQFQSDVLGLPLARPRSVESTAIGAAYLAGLATGFWASTDELRGLRAMDRTFSPNIDADRRDALVDGWRAAARRTMTSGKGNL